MCEDNTKKSIKMSKKFNKKKWREQRYSGKAKVQKWENTRRKEAQRQFTKELKKLNGNYNSPKEDNTLNKNKSSSSFKEAHLKFKEMKRIKEDKEKEQERIRTERKEAIRAYKEKKALLFRKLSQKTSKGQPLMKTRIELLLEKIQRDYNNSAS